MPDQIEHPFLENLRIETLQSNSLTDHPSEPEEEFDFGLEQLFESNLESNTNRIQFDEANVTGITITGFPGVGKTALLEYTIDKLPSTIRSAVLKAETSTEIDSDRLKLLGIPTVPIITEQSYRLTADLVTEALEKINLENFDAIFVEEATLNSLPGSAYGAHKKVVVLSITSGEELPRKYPQMLTEADCVVITKTDLLPHLQADLGLLLDNIEDIRPGLPIFDLSVQSGDGTEAWIRWLVQQMDETVVAEADMMYSEKPVYVPFIG